MNIELPLLVQVERDPFDGSVIHLLRPLFFAGPQVSDEHLGKAMSKMADALRKLLGGLGRSGNHRALAEYTFCPEVELHRLELRLELRSGSFHLWVPVATFRTLDRQVAFCPLALDLWFDAQAKDALRARATEAFTRHFRKIEREEGQQELRGQLEPFSEKTARPWIAHLELDIPTRRQLPRETSFQFATLADTAPIDGAGELEKVGRCLDRLYPDRLDRALLRDDLCEELERVLADSRHRPVLLVGPPMVGKTALIHECVYRHVARRDRAHHGRENFWLISPQRLIAGMSCVGQWENRLLAILKTARKRGHVLCFDDLLGLYRAGVHSQSNLSVADVLKPYVERGDVRILAEMTGDALRVFRERDRGFADLFHLIPVPEPGQRETIEILIHVARSLEGRQRARFRLEVLPTVLELTRRYQRDAAYPGKAARWLGQLAVKYRGGEVTREMALAEFRDTSGLEAGFLDVRRRLKRQEIVEALQAHLVGQQAAVEAMADVVSIARARLNDPQRPLASLFFLGPTGVGKTESAKALARYLFGDASRLLRFDMNEFVSAHAAARLVGTFEQPEGLLTGAARRQPFCVILLDEIEKAHPAVFDLLLQILGEARLTDALGRTADFGNAVMILTSNLGTREAAQAIGFGTSAGGDQAIYHRAVQDFFRPEFFNRLDRIVPFARLEKRELQGIARNCLERVLQREGVRRRRCAIEVTGDALEWVVDRGYHPLLGARAMKRAIESQMVQPLGAELAAISPETPTVLRIFRVGQQLAVRVHPLREPPPPPEEPAPDPATLLAAARQSLDRIEQLCVRHRPSVELIAGRIPPEYSWYLGTAEYLKDTRRILARIQEAILQPRSSMSLPAISVQRTHRKTLKRREDVPHKSLLQAFHAVEDIYDYLLSIPSQADSPGGDRQGALRRVQERIALLDLMSPGDDGWATESALVVVRSLGDAAVIRDWLVQRLAGQFVFQAGFDGSDREASAAVEFGLEHTRLSDRPAAGADRVWWELIADPSRRQSCRASHHLDALVFQGHHALRFLERQQGTHLFVRKDGRLQPVQVVVRPLVGDLGESLLELLAAHERAILAEPTARPEDDRDPFRWRPLVAVYTEPRDFVVDVELDFSRL